MAASFPSDYRSARRGPYGVEVQTVPGTLRGYRAWQVDRDWRFLGLYNTGLTSLSSGFCEWNSRKPQRAECKAGWNCDCGLRFCPFCCELRSHRSPAVGCSCGYYATYDPSSYRQHVGTFGTYVHGCIKAYGRISLGTRGFRAEYAQVEAVYGRSARAAARRYRVPWFRSQERMLEHFPPQDVTELLQ